MATKKRKSKKSAPKTPRAKKSTKKRAKKGAKRLWGAALAKHNEKLARLGKPPVSGSSPKVKAPRPPGAKHYPLHPPKRKSAMVPALDAARNSIAREAKKAADELAAAGKELKKLKGVAKHAAKKVRRRKKATKKEKAVMTAAFTARHGMSPAAFVKKSHKKHAKKAHRKASSNERRVTAKEILGGKGQKKAPQKGGKSLHVWLCAGPRRTGCGGGKKGGHVIGMLR